MAIKLKNIGIVTIDDVNYGNRLQNYAMVKKLSEYGKVYNIRRKFACEEWSYFNLTVKKEIKNAIISQLNIIRHNLEWARLNNFNRFNKAYIPNCKYVFSKNTKYEKMNSFFDYYVVGSDQIWNPKFFKDMYINMLSFASSNKKIAVAPSISRDSLSDKDALEFKERLKDFKYISCREEQGAALLESIIGKEVVSLLDPTLMLSDKEWDEVSKKPKFHDESKKYIFLYFLGTMTEEYTSIINSIKEKYELEVINVLDKSSKYYSCGPSQFVYLIKNSQLVLTDSFHGSVFSYIYNKPFRIFYRQGEGGYMNSRLTNLMNKLNLDESIYLKEDDCLDNIMAVNYDKTRLEFEQKKFNDYLQKVFEN